MPGEAGTLWRAHADREDPMSRITLYHAPFACSKVSLNALEEAGVE